MDLTRELSAEEREWVEAWLPGLPMRIARRQVEDRMGGVVSYKALCNEDSRGQGPAVRYEVGTSTNARVLYDTRALLEWIVRRYGVTPRTNLAGMAARTVSPRRTAGRRGSGARTAGSSPGTRAA